MHCLSRPVGLFCTALFLAFILSGNPAKAQQQSPASTDAQATVVAATSTVAEVPQAAPSATVPAVAPPAPVWATPSLVGPLELTPAPANLRLKRGAEGFAMTNNHTTFLSTLRFKIRNISASDVKIILFKESVLGSDDHGMSSFKDNYIKSGGIQLSEQRKDSFDRAFKEEKNKFITLKPKQAFEVQLQGQDERVHIPDEDLAIYNSHRPKTVSFSGTLGIVNIDGTNELGAFSFSDVPVTVVAPKL